MSDFVLNAGLLSWVGDWFYGLWINLWLLIDNVLFAFINWIYRAFLLIADVNIFSGDQIKEITTRLYLIVGIVMLFIFAYNIILLIINPEGKQLSNMGKIVQNALISIMLVTLLPTIYSYLTTIQSHILSSGVIENLILGGDATKKEKIQQHGVTTSLTIFSAFYRPEGETYYSCKHGGTHEMCDKYVSAYDEAINNGNVSSFIWNDDLKTGAKEGKIEYSWIICSVAGVCALWMFVSFGLDIGVRVGKLAFYQIISPIPVMMRIMPGDKMFDKWFKGITRTFISLFIRLAVIYFCMYAITLIPDVMNGMWAERSDSAIIIALANVALILGILQFAKEAPGLIGDILSTGGDGLKFGIASKIKENKYAMAGMGGVGAGFGGMTGNAWNSWKKMGKDKTFKENASAFVGGITSGIGGFFGGARRGVVNGYKADSFKGLGAGITQGKQDAYVARDKRDTNQSKNKEAGKIRGKKVPVISNALGGIKRGVQGAWGDSLEWMAGEEAYSPRAEAVSKAKSKNSALKGDTYSKGGKYVSDATLNSMKDAIRRGEKIEYGEKFYQGDPSKMSNEAEYARSIENAIKNLSDKVKSDNKDVRVKNYKDKAYVLEAHLEELRKEINNGRAVYGKDIEDILTSKIQEAASKTSGDVKTALEGLVVNGKVQFDNVDSFLKKTKSYLETDVSISDRRAIAEFVDAFDSTMKLASERNVVEKKDK